MKDRPTTRLVATVLLTLCACGTDLAPEPEPSPTPTAEFSAPAEPWTELGTFPASDQVWADAFFNTQKLERLEEMRAFLVDLGERYPERWEPIWIAAWCADAMGDRAFAVRAHQEALERARRAGDPIGTAATACAHDTAVGWAAFAEGRLREAEAVLREGLDAARRAKRSDLQGHCLNRLAEVSWNAGDFEPAADLSEEAARAFASFGWEKMAQRVRYNTALQLLQLRDFRAAETILLQVDEGSRLLQDHYLTVRGTVTLGDLYFAMEDYGRALEQYEKLPPDATELLAFADFNRGRLAFRSGDLAEARRRFEAVSAQDENAIIRLLGEAHLARVDWALGQRDAARKRLRQIASDADSQDAEEPAWVSRWLLGVVSLGEARYDDAIVALREAIAIIERQGDALDAEAEGFRFLRERSDPYVDLAVALCRGGATSASDVVSEILGLLQRTHARALSRTLRRAMDDAPGAALTPLQTSLRTDEWLLGFLLGDERGLVVVVGRDVARAVPIAGRDELRPLLRRYLAALRRPLHSADARMSPEADLARSLETGRRLHELLLGPAADLLHGARRLYVVPDRDLALLPLGALPVVVPGDSAQDRPRFLGEETEIAVLPLAGATSAWDHGYSPLLLGGDPLPDAEGRFPVLPLAALELNLIAKTWQAGDITGLRGDALTAARLAAQPLATFRTIHLSTHAIASDVDPRSCAVYLSGGERLGLADIVKLKLDASPLVVLSACRSGEGELIAGEGVVGLGWAFLRAGARGVVVSLWSVEDAATAELMVAFHRGLRDGLDPVAALSSAQRQVAAERFHPAYWAPFVIVLRPDVPS